MVSILSTLSATPCTVDTFARTGTGEMRNAKRENDPIPQTPIVGDGAGHEFHSTYPGKVCVQRTCA